MKKSRKLFSYMKQKHTNDNLPSFPSPTLPSFSTNFSPRPSPEHRPLSPINGTSFSQPQFVDLARCNHQKFLKSVTRNFVRYLTCFKGTEPRPNPEAKGKSKRLENIIDKKNQRSGYYSEMNDEERAEKLQSAINYCNSNCILS